MCYDNIDVSDSLRLFIISNTIFEYFKVVDLVAKKTLKEYFYKTDNEWN